MINCSSPGMSETLPYDHSVSDEGMAMQQRCLRASAAYKELAFVAESLQLVVDESEYEISDELKPGGRLMFHRATQGFKLGKSCVGGRFPACEI